MKYIKGMNIDYVNHDYLKEHFADDDAPPVQPKPEQT